MELTCFRCGKKPEEISEYVAYGRASKMTPSQFVLEEEGTLNMTNGHFCCTQCYLKIGMPSAPGGWKAP